MRKISREGIVLIKSFEGFRPRAIARAEGGWIIGYGHTLSAREGATVSEADAELLLRYDLLPIEKSVNTAAPGVLNQHQFDALVSFGFSVGRDRFDTSDVLARLSSGATTEAAEAMMAWPATEIATAGLRRRAAERALFTADPSRPISLADLLTVPVPDALPDIAQTLAPEPEPESVSLPVADPIGDAAAIEAVPTEADTVVSAEPTDTRNAAVAALLGEPESRIVEPEPIVPSFAPIPAEADLAISETDTVQQETPITVPVEPTPNADAVGGFAANDAEASGDIAEPTATASEPVEAAYGAERARAEIAPGPDLSAINIQRYAPYGTPIIGPLPFLQPAADRNDEPATASAPVTFESAQASEALVLTSPEDAPPAVIARPAWTADEREEAETVAQPEAGLFGDDLSLTQGGQPLGRPDFEATAPESFDWSETGAFIIMGAVGLTAFGASMAAFRLASEQGGGDETSIIGWVLAVIGVACVGVSSLNLYRRFGLPGGDR
jgi:lysozyme